MKSYKTIMVCMIDHRQAEEVLGVALALARRYGSHLIGVCAFADINWPPMLVPGSGQIHGTTSISNPKHEESLAAVFSTATANQPITAEWRSLPVSGFDIGTALVDVARSADLVVIGQPTAHCDGGVASGLAERLAVESGRPVLALPLPWLARDKNRLNGVGRDVLVAWKSTREAARALFDALPLLRDATRVHIVEIKDPAVADNDLKRDLVAALGRADVAASFESVVASDVDPGSELLSRAAEQGADLIVMGAYGHSRFRQFVFGGVTRHVARHMTIPTLWSH